MQLSSMKAERKHDYFIEGFGNVIFIKVDIGSGHHTFKVFWRRIGEERGSFVAWMQEGLKPSAKLAVFYCKLACAVEDWVRTVLLPRQMLDSTQENGRKKFGVNNSQ